MVFLKARFALVLSFAFLLILAQPRHAAAQQTLGGITGTVTDTGGGLVPNVSVTAVEEGTHLTRTADSSSSGSYAFVNLPIGTYTLTFNEVFGYGVFRVSSCRPTAR